MQDPRDSLLLVARLRAALRSTALQRALSEDATATRSRQLNDIETSALSAHAPVQFPDLLGEIERTDLRIDLTILRDGLGRARLQRIDVLRSAA